MRTPKNYRLVERKDCSTCSHVLVVTPAPPVANCSEYICQENSMVIAVMQYGAVYEAMKKVCDDWKKK